MIEHLEVHGRDRVKIVCDGCGVDAMAGVYPTERKALQALKSAGKSLRTLAGVIGGSWRCDKCRKTFVEREREGKA